MVSALLFVCLFISVNHCHGALYGGTECCGALCSGGLEVAVRSGMAALLRPCVGDLA